MTDLDTFERGVWEAKTFLKGYAMKSVANVDDADDLVSTTMLRALAHRHLFEEGTNLNAWMMTIMKNLIRDRHNKGYRKQGGPNDPRVPRVTYTDDAHYADHLVAADDPERAMIVVEGYDALSALPAAQQEAVVLAGLGLSQEEMSQQLGIPLGTVKTRIHRGREALAAITGGLA